MSTSQRSSEPTAGMSLIGDAVSLPRRSGRRARSVTVISALAAVGLCLVLEHGVGPSLSLPAQLVLGIVIYLINVAAIEALLRLCGRFDLLEPIHALLLLLGLYSWSALAALYFAGGLQTWAPSIPVFCAAVNVGAVAFGTGYIAIRWQSQEGEQLLDPPVVQRRFLWAVAALAIALTASTFGSLGTLLDPRQIRPYVETAFASRVDKPLTWGLGNYLLDSAITLITYGLFVLSPRNRTMRPVAVIIIGYLALVNVMTGSKAFLLQVCLLVIALISPRRRRKALAVGVVAVTLFYPFATLLPHVRFTSDLSEMYEAAAEVLRSDPWVLSPHRGGELNGPPLLLLTVVDDVQKGGLDYSYGAHWVQEIAVFIPRFLYPSRPLPLSEWYQQRYLPESYATGGGSGGFLLLDGFYAFGLLGVVVVLFAYGLITARVYEFFARRPQSHYRLMYAVIVLPLALTAVRTGFFLSLKMTLMTVAPFTVAMWLSRRSLFKAFTRPRRRVVRLGSAEATRGVVR